MLIWEPIPIRNYNVVRGHVEIDFDAVGDLGPMVFMFDPDKGFCAVKAHDNGVPVTGHVRCIPLAEIQNSECVIFATEKPWWGSHGRG